MSCAVVHDLIRVALDGGDPLAAVPDALACVFDAHRERWAVVLAPNWHPDHATELSTAAFPDPLRAAIDLVGDTDTVAAVTGALAGAVYGLPGVPETWRSVLHVTVPGWDGPRTAEDLIALACSLVGRQ